MLARNIIFSFLQSSISHLWDGKLKWRGSLPRVQGQGYTLQDTVAGTTAGSLEGMHSVIRAERVRCRAL